MTAAKRSLIAFLIALPAAGCIAQPPLPVTRADLAASYLELEQQYFGQPPADPAAIADANRRFDRATIAFFSGQGASAIQQIEALIFDLRGAATTSAARVAASLKATIEPPVFVLGSDAPISVRFTGMYPIAGFNEGVETQIVVRDAAGSTVGEAPARVRFFPGPDGFVDTTVPLTLSNDATPGTVTVALLADDATPLGNWKWNLVGESLDARRLRAEAALDALAAPPAALADAFAVCRARARLLSDRPSEANSAQYLTDFETLSAEVAAETAALAAGRNPYRGKTGAYYRPLLVGTTEIPAWVYAPPIADAAARLPVVIAFHGAGGDEAMFVYGYGAGRLLQLAAERGFIVVSPASSPFASSFTHFDALLDRLAADYTIDANRVYVLGHSAGAAAAVSLAAGRAQRIAAAATFAGATRLPRASPPVPLLATLGQLDPLAAPARAQPQFDAAIAAGLPIEVRVIEGYGHTLLVGAQLPAALDWLLARSRPDSASAAAATAASRPTPPAGAAP